jgi:hypothetical protein
MDFTDFDMVFWKLCSVLDDLRKKDASSDLIWGNYYFFNAEIKQVVRRIEEEKERFAELNDKINTTIMAHNHIDFDKTFSELILLWNENFVLLRLDIKTFYFITKIFLDTLSRVVRLCYGKKGEQLPKRMTKLLNPSSRTEELIMNLDQNFFQGLKGKMQWYHDFKDERDKVVHNLSFLSYLAITEKQDDLIFTWVKKPYSPIKLLQYIENTLEYLNDIISYIYEKISSVNIS